MSRTRTALLVVLSLATGFGLAIALGERSPAPLRRSVPTAADFLNALAEEDPLARTQRLSGLLVSFDPEQLPAALEAFQSDAVDPAFRDFELLMFAWTRFDAPGAYAWASGYRSTMRKAVLRAAIGAWARHDPDAAARRVEELEASPSKGEQRLIVVAAWARNPAVPGLDRHLATLPPGAERQDALRRAIASMNRDGSDTMMRWVEAIPDDDDGFKRDAFQIASRYLARSEPRRAADWYAAWRDRPWVGDALEAVARRWVEYHEPAALFAWLDALPAGEDREGAVRAGISAWVEHHRGEAEAWLAAANVSPRVHDVATSTFALATAFDSPRLAVERAMQIRDADIRHATLVPLGRLWARVDRAALEAWLHDQDLPEAVKSRMLSPARLPRRPAPKEGS